MKYESKKALIEDIEHEHARFLETAAQIPKNRYRDPGVWGDDWTVKDLFVHLTAWEQLFLGWYRDGEGGEPVALPAPGFKWKDTPRLNQQIWKQNARKSWTRVEQDFEASYREILSLAKELPPRKLMRAGVFAWTKKNPLVSYLSANTASHYRTATKILKRWLRSQ